MRKTPRLTDAEIRDKIRAGTDFTVKYDSERKRALWIAGVIGADVVTRAVKGGFQIIIPSEVEN